MLSSTNYPKHDPSFAKTGHIFALHVLYSESFQIKINWLEINVSLLTGGVSQRERESLIDEIWLHSDTEVLEA